MEFFESIINNLNQEDKKKLKDGILDILLTAIQKDIERYQDEEYLFEYSSVADL